MLCGPPVQKVPGGTKLIVGLDVGKFVGETVGDAVGSGVAGHICLERQSS